jgi:glutamate synthase domain-containing protein 3
MSGGFAYVLDEDGSFRSRINSSRVEPLPLEPDDEETVLRMVRLHFKHTRSTRADEILRKWNSFAPLFVKVFPKDLMVAIDARLEAHTGDG